MTRIDAIPVEQAAAFEGLKIEAFKKRLKRKKIQCVKGPTYRQRKLVPVTALSPTAREAFFKQQACSALELLAPQSEPSPSGNGGSSQQSILPFAPPSKTAQALSDAAPVAIPASQRAHIDKWADIIGDCRNGTWKVHRG